MKYGAKVARMEGATGAWSLGKVDTDRVRRRQVELGRGRRRTIRERDLRRVVCITFNRPRLKYGFSADRLTAHLITEVVVRDFRITLE